MCEREKEKVLRERGIDILHKGEGLEKLGKGWGEREKKRE